MVIGGLLLTLGGLIAVASRHHPRRMMRTVGDVPRVKATS
jgi:hypothetical protein